MSGSKFGGAGVRSVVLFVTIGILGSGLLIWKSARRSAEAAMVQPEPAEVVSSAEAVGRQHRNTATAIGTVIALRSITLRNEVPGTVARVHLRPGDVVERGAVLIGLDVSVEEAELKALEARAAVAERTLARLERMRARQAVSAIELDQARAERDVALAEIERTRALIARKTIRAPFHARIGLSNVHRGQFLEAGTLLTTLQGVDEAAHLDFAVAQDVAAGLRPNDPVEIYLDQNERSVLTARIVAVDARVDPTTRSATVRARIEHLGDELRPGASVRVRVPVGAPRLAVVVPVSALRKGPAGDHVFVLTSVEGETRAQLRSVEAGAVLGDSIVILGGLEAGEVVATAGSFKLREGALVQVAAPPAPAVAAER